MSFTIDEIYDALKYHDHTYDLTTIEVLEIAKRELKEQKEDLEEQAQLEYDKLQDELKEEFDAVLADLENRVIEIRKHLASKKVIEIEDILDILEDLENEIDNKRG